MKRLALLLLLAACTSRPPADPAVAHIREVLARNPDSTPHLYVLATSYDENKDTASVVRTLARLDELGWSLGVDLDSFPNSAASPEFQSVAARLAARELPVRRASRAFTMPASVRSEGIAYDPVDGLFYFSGGADKLLRVDRSGIMTELPVEPFDTAGRLGMDVDAERRTIWVVNAPLREPGRSGVSVYDLRDGRLLRRVTLGSRAEPAFLNDLTVLPDGTAFVTDTNRHHVYRLAPGADAFERWADGFRWPNGIVHSADGRTLYVADFRGVEQLDLATKARRLLATPTPLNGIDGLVEHRGSLIGISNVLGRPRVVRVDPATARVELLEAASAFVHSPATGVVEGEEYFYLSNLREKDVEKVVAKIDVAR